MASLNRLLFGMILLIICNKGSGQRIFFEQITTAEGLPSDYVNTVYSDSKGSLWVGTDKGAARYNGSQILLLNNDNGLSSNFVTSFEEDPSGNIWIGTLEAGLNKFDGKKTTRFSFLDNNLIIYKICFNKDSSFFVSVGRPGSRDLYYFKNEYTAPQIFRDMAFLKTLSPGIYMTGSLNQFYILKLTNKQIELLPVDIPKKALTDFLWQLGNDSFIGIKKNSVLEYTTDGNHWTIKKEFPVNKFNLAPEWPVIKNIVIDKNELLAATSIGLIYIDEGRKEHFLNAENGLGSDFVNYIYKDRHGNIYIGTYGAGIKIWPKRYMAEFSTSGKTTSIFHTGINSYITSTKAVYHFNGSTDQFQELKNENTGSFTTIYKDPAGELYLGTLNNYYILKQNAFSIHSKRISKSVPFRANTGTSGFIAFKKNIYISSYGDGIYIVNSQHRIVDTLNEISNPPAPQVTEFLVPTSSSIAALTYNAGVTFYDSSGGYKKLTRANGLLSNAVYSVFQENENNIWIGTQGGLQVYDGQKIKRSFTSADGLAGTKVLCVFKDSLNRFWVLSDKYLHLMENDQLRAIRSHPVLYNEKNSINRAGFNTATQTLFIGLTDALLTVDISKVTPNKDVEDPLLDLVKKDSVVITGNKDKISIDHPASRIVFQFTPRYNSVTRRSKIYYKLQGYDDDWLKLAETGEIIYPKLSPGHYELLAKSVNPDGYESVQKSMIKLEVLPPIWKRIWFITALVIITLFLVFYIGNLISKRRYKYKLLALQEKYRLQLERERIARELHDNVGSQLTYLINKIDDDYVHLSEKKEAEKLSSFARGAMRELRETIWALDKKEVSWDDLENKIRQLLHLYKNKNHVVLLDWGLNNTALIPLNSLQALHIYRIIQEALNNAEKYSGAGEIRIAAYNDNENLCIEINDNGKGFDPEQAEHGYGLNNMKKRAEELNAKLIVESKQGNGTSIKLELSGNQPFS